MDKLILTAISLVVVGVGIGFYLATILTGDRVLLHCGILASYVALIGVLVFAPFKAAKGKVKGKVESPEFAPY